MIWQWWMTLLVIFAALFLLGCLPLGVDAAYREETFFLSLKIGFFHFSILPAKPKKPKKPKKQKSAPPRTVPEPASASAPPAKKPLLSDLTPQKLLSLARLALDLLGDLRHKLRVNELTLHFALASDDPADTALHYGEAWAVIGALTPLLDRLFVIKKRDIRPILDYTIVNTTLEAHLILTITLGRALALSLRALVNFFKLSKKGGVTL